jgi:hypothetical protein
VSVSEQCAASSFGEQTQPIVEVEAERSFQAFVFEGEQQVERVPPALRRWRRRRPRAYRALRARREQLRLANRLYEAAWEFLLSPPRGAGAA